MTARLDNAIGRISLPLAYDYVGKPRNMILEDSPALHMAYTTIHQLQLVEDHLAELDPERWMQVRFEDLIAEPTSCVGRVSTWLGLPRRKHALEDLVGPIGAIEPETAYPREVAAETKAILDSLRMRYGYVRG
jgi:hypothetical protein